MSYMKKINLDSGDNVPIITDYKYPIEDFVSLEALFQEIKKNFVATCFRIFVLYHDETIHYEIPQEDILQGGSYQENYQNGQRRSLSFSLYNEDGKYTPNINTLWAGTRLALEAGIKLASGDVIWFRKGIFVINDISAQLSPEGKQVQISAGDKFSIFENNTGKLEDTVQIPVGSNIKDLIRNILMTELGNGEVMDTKDFRYPEVYEGRQIEVEIIQQAGGTYGEILLDIATQLSAEIFYDSDGALVLMPMVQASLDEYKGSIGHFITAEGDLDGLNFQFVYSGIINKVIVQGQSSAGNIYRAEAVNNDPASPLCASRIGTRTVSLSDSGIYSDTLAQERANYELRQYAILKTTSQASCLFNPFLTVNNIIKISDEYYNLLNERFLIQSISFSIDYSNTISIEFSNQQNLPFLTHGDKN